MAKAKKLPSGRWRTQVFSHTDGDGKKHYRSFTAATKKESEYLAAQFTLYKSSESPYDNYTVSELIKLYIDSKENSLSPSTIEGYMTHFRNHYDDIGRLKVKMLDSAKIQKWIGNINCKLSPKSVHNAYGLLTATLNFFETNIRLKVKLPQLIVRDTYIPVDDDIKTLMDYYKKNNKDMYIAVLLAAFGTLRRGEVCALTRDDVNENVVTINKSMVRKNGQWIIKPVPKNKSSNRHVTYAQFIIDELPPSGRLVNMYPDSITDNFADTIRALNLPHFTFHDLRHYSASIMHAIGVPDQYIIERGGWSSDETLKRIYRNSLTDYQQKYTQQTNEYFEKVSHEISHEKNNPL